MVERLGPLKSELVVLEASGGYAKAAWLGLWSAAVAASENNLSRR